MISIGFSAFLHRDILFNLFNFGHHWDWTFYPIAPFYRNFITSFFYAIKENSFSYYDVLSISIGEFSIKLLILILFNALNALHLFPITIPVLNKIMVFILLPFFSSIGVWFLCGRPLSNLRKISPTRFFITALFCNLFYTYSLISIFDLHGGALNRQIAMAIFPWLYYFIYRYFYDSSQNSGYFNIASLSLLFIFLDISNIFYFLVLLMSVVLLKPQRSMQKVYHLTTAGIIISLVNLYWLHALILPGLVNISLVAAERKNDLSALLEYSSSFFENMFLLRTPHDLINITFPNNFFILINSIVIYLLILVNLARIQMSKADKRYLFFILIALGFSLILTGGVKGFGGIYQILYSFPYFGFLRGAIRYMPNLTLTVLFLYVSLKGLNKQHKKSFETEDMLLIIASVFWIIFLTINTPLISKVLHNTKTENGINHHMGSLYNYSASAYSEIQNDKLIYHILPLPSWYSPIFIDNVYPKTSQGSSTDNLYLGKGTIFTNGTSLLSSSLITSFIQSPSSSFLALGSIGKILPLNDQTPINASKFTFDTGWLKKAVPHVQKTDYSNFVQVDDSIFYPIIYSPKAIFVNTMPSTLLSVFMKSIDFEATTSMVVNQFQNEKLVVDRLLSFKSIPNNGTLEYKKLSPTLFTVTLHNISESLPIVLNLNYHRQWAAYAISSNKEAPPLQKLAENYKVLEGNAHTQASVVELKNFMKNGWITTLGDGKVQKLTLYSYEIGGEIEKHSTSYIVNYVSKNYRGSIQNDNLVAPRFMQKKVEIDASNHFVANGYSNGWIINPKDLCTRIQCKKNDDGSVNIAITLEFKPQNYYLIALTISITTLILGGVLLVVLRKNYAA